MKIRVLVEDTSVSKEFRSEHGLSLFIETKAHRLLFDLGQTGLFLENARKMSADVGSVDTAILSHGHYDHGGGIAAFLARNDRANVYVHARAFEAHYAVREGGRIEYIGLDPSLEGNPRVRKTDGLRKLDDELTVFSGVPSRLYWPPANRTLLKKAPDGYAPDDFAHEQNLIVTENGEDVLFTGCAHNGVVGIVEAARALRGKTPRAVVGGFHLCLKEGMEGENGQTAAQVADALQKYGATYYTGHCTGEGGVRMLEERIGAHALSTGMEFDL